jgi:hypothetical protein
MILPTKKRIGVAKAHIRAKCRVSKNSLISQARVQNVCSFLEVSPVKAATFNKLNSLQRIEVVKRKADSIAAAVVDDLSTAIQVPFVPVNYSLVELTSQAADLSTLMDALKEKVNASSKFSERLQLLTLTPDSWSRERVATEFQVSVVRAARKLKEERGILPFITSKPAGNRLLQITIDAVTQFYLDEEISRYCPGMKDYMMVNLEGKKVPVSKR